MTFLVEITLIAEAQIEQAYQWYRERNPEFADHWFRGLMNAIATLQEKPQRCTLGRVHLLHHAIKTSFCICENTIMSSAIANLVELTNETKHLLFA